MLLNSDWLIWDLPPPLCHQTPYSSEAAREGPEGRQEGGRELQRTRLTTDFRLIGCQCCNREFFGCQTRFMSPRKSFRFKAFWKLNFNTGRQKRSEFLRTFDLNVSLRMTLKVGKLGQVKVESNSWKVMLAKGGK